MSDTNQKPGQEVKEVSLDEGLQLAMQLHQSGRLTEAEAIYKSILKVAPRHPATQHYYGLLQFQKGDKQAAIEHIRAALASDPKYVDAYNNLGNVYFTEKQWDQAQRAYERVLELIPEHVGALNNLGAIYRRQHRLADALAIYRRARSAAPDNGDVPYNTGNLLHELGRREEAVEAYRDAVRLNPERSAAHRALGKVLSELRRDDEALAARRKAVELNTEHAETQCELGHSLQVKGLLDDALTAYRKAIALKPDHSDAYEQAATVLYKQQRWDESRGLVRQWLQAQPNNPVAQHRAAAILQEAVPSRASDGYVRHLFDNFSEVFDTLLERLDYRAPELLVQRLVDLGLEATGELNVLDAGCGTGLCGPLLRPYAKQLIGVDLSTKMLEKAEERGEYDRLETAELTSYLQTQADRFDLILSADTLVYFGELEEVVRAAAESLRSGGWFVFSVEQETGSEPYVLGAHGRYRHSADYLQRALRDAGLGDVSLSSAVLRKESEQPVQGWLVAARRRVYV